MALITRCPVCGTLFKVVPDQLRISEGWVRCGHCAEIFDASGDLQQSDAENPWTQPGPAPLPAVPSEPFASAFVPERIYERFEATSSESSQEPIGLSELEHEVSEPVVFKPEAEQGPFSGPEGIDLPEAADTPIAEDALNNLSPLNPEPVLTAQTMGYSFTNAPSGPTVMVLYPVLWGLWTVTALLLGLALMLQGLVHGRDKIAATWPEAKPLLQAVCARMACSVQPLRQIDAIVIDSSTLSALQNEDAFRLSLVLKNQSQLDLAMPAVELVLTDFDEQTVFRRVLMPTELGAPSRVLFAEREWATSVDLRIIDTPNKGRIVGYRLLAFYP